MNAACLFSCRKELLRRVGEFSEIVPKPYTRARASFILGDAKNVPVGRMVTTHVCFKAALLTRCVLSRPPSKVRGAF